MRTKPYSPITINTKGGVFVFGDNIGTIKQETVVSFSEINDLIKVIKNSSLPDTKKRGFIADCETIRAQLTKPKPDKTILQRAWDSLQAVSAIKETAELLKTIYDYIAHLIK